MDDVKFNRLRRDVPRLAIVVVIAIVIGFTKLSITAPLIAIATTITKIIKNTISYTIQSIFAELQGISDLLVRKDFHRANSGVSLPETAKIIGASQATVSRLMKRHGWKKLNQKMLRLYFNMMLKMC